MLFTWQALDHILDNGVHGDVYWAVDARLWVFLITHPDKSILTRH